MSVTVVTDKGTFKGRKLESLVRTNFGEKAVFVPSEIEDIAGHISIYGEEGVVATVTRVIERVAVEQKSRTTRWQDACSNGSDAVSEATQVFEELEAEEIDEEEAEGRLAEASSQLESAMSTLEEIQGEYQDWLDNLSDGLREGPTAEKLEEVCQLDLSYEEFDVHDGNADTQEQTLADAEAADLPLGWGRD